jgi:hypothetical protein
MPILSANGSTPRFLPSLTGLKASAAKIKAPIIAPTAKITMPLELHLVISLARESSILPSKAMIKNLN